MMKMIYRKKLLGLLLIFISSPLSSQELSNIPGAFSEAGFGVRPSGMGQAFTSILDDNNLFFVLIK